VILGGPVRAASVSPRLRGLLAGLAAMLLPCAGRAAAGVGRQLLTLTGGRQVKLVWVRAKDEKGLMLLDGHLRDVNDKPEYSLVLRQSCICG
jgi:hypothetical protein